MTLIFLSIPNPPPGFRRDDELGELRSHREEREPSLCVRLFERPDDDLLDPVNGMIGEVLVDLHKGGVDQGARGRLAKFSQGHGGRGKYEVGEFTCLQIFCHVVGDSLHKAVFGNTVPVRTFHRGFAAKTVIHAAGLVASLIAGGGIFLLIGALQPEVRKHAVAVIAQNEG